MQRVYPPKGIVGRAAFEANAIKELGSTVSKGLAPLFWLLRILLAGAVIVLLIWALITAVHWFWGHPLW
jgi:hypothetical protein